MNPQPSIDEALKAYSVIDPYELGEDKFAGHHDITEAKQQILSDLLALLPRPNLIHLHDPLDQIPALCVPCAQLASLEHIRTAIKRYVGGS